MPSDAFIGNCRAFANPVSPDEILKNRGPCTTNGTPGSDVRTHAIDNSIATCSIDGGDPMAFEHDGAGNLKKDCNYLYDYDCENRLTRVRRPDGENPPVTVAEYGYNALGWRVKKVVSNSGSLNGTWRMIYNAAWQLLETRTVSGQSQTTFRQFVHAGAPSPWLGRGSGASMGGLTPASYIDDHVAMIDPAASGDGYYQYYHVDALYNTMAISDGAGSITERADYDPYSAGLLLDATGQPLATSAIQNPFDRLGQVAEPETRHLNARRADYLPEHGRSGQARSLGIPWPEIMVAGAASPELNSPSPSGQTENTSDTKPIKPGDHWRADRPPWVVTQFCDWENGWSLNGGGPPPDDIQYRWGALTYPASELRDTLGPPNFSGIDRYPVGSNAIMYMARTTWTTVSSTVEGFCNQSANFSVGVGFTDPVHVPASWSVSVDVFVAAIEIDPGGQTPPATFHITTVMFSFPALPNTQHKGSPVAEHKVFAYGLGSKMDPWRWTPPPTWTALATGFTGTIGKIECRRNCRMATDPQLPP